MSDESLDQLAGSIVRQRAPAGQELCREGESGDRMYVILAGSVSLVKTVDGHVTQIGTLEGGAYFGEMALIGDAPRSATVVAVSVVDYLMIDRDTLLRVIGGYPSVALEMLKGYNARLAQTTERLAQLTARQEQTQPDEDASDSETALAVSDPFHQQLQQAVQAGPYPLAVLARKIQVETAWGRKVLQALDLFEIVVKYTTLVLLADYLRRPTDRRPDLDQTIVAAFRRPTLGQLIELTSRLLRTYAGRQGQLFMPELYTLYFQPESGRAPSARSFQTLTAYRNRLKHGGEGVWDDDVYRADFEGGDQRISIRHHLTNVLQHARFLEAYPLIYITSMTYEHGVFEYAYERCVGAYADFDRGILTYARPLDNRRLYLLSPRDNQVLRLDPLFRREKCPTCGRHSVFTLFSFFPAKDRAVRRDAAETSIRERLEYLSYPCGHTLQDQVTADRLARGEGLSPLVGGGVATGQVGPSG